MNDVIEDPVLYEPYKMALYYHKKPNDLFFGILRHFLERIVNRLTCGGSTEKISNRGRMNRQPVIISFNRLHYIIFLF